MSDRDDDFEPTRFSRSRYNADDARPLDVQHFENAMGMVLDRLEELKGEQPVAIATAIRSVLTDPAVVEQVMNLVATKAQERTVTAAGRGVVWFAKNVLSRWLVIGATVLLLAKIAGWDVAAKFGKWISSTP